MPRVFQGLIFLVLAGLIFLLLDVRFTGGNSYVIGCNPEKVQELSFYSAELGKTYQLTRKAAGGEGTWWIEQDDWGAWAVDDEVARLLYLACSLSYTEKLAIEEDNVELLQQFGLFNSPRRLVLRTDEDTQLVVGSLTPEGTEFYLKSSHQPRNVFLVPNIPVQGIFSDATRLVKQPLLEVTQGTFHIDSDYHGLHLVLQGDENKWNYTQSSEHVVASAEQVLSALKSLGLVGFIGRVNAQEYGFAEPEFQLTWELGRDKHTFFLSFADGKYYLGAPRQDKISAYILNEPSYQQFLNTLFAQNE